MPEAARSLCRVSQCGAFAVSMGRCPAHQRAHWRTEERRRGTATQRGYDADWLRVRASALRRDRGLCVACTAQGYVTPAVEVDHVVPLALGGARLEVGNLQSLCHCCHSAKTTQEQVYRVKTTR